MYNILTTYKTGDSYNTYIDKDFVGYSWHTIEDAKKAVEDIIEHNKFVQKLESGYIDEEYFEDYFLSKDLGIPDWIYLPDGPRPRDFVYKMKNRLHIFTSDSMPRKLVQAFWQGHFERLISLEIVIATDKVDDLVWYV